MRKYKGVMASVLTVGLVMGLSACSGDADKAADKKETQEDTINKALAAEGEKIAKSSCAGCHGVDLKGDLGPNLHNLSLSREEIIEILIKGRKTMPPGSANGKEEEVAEYLMTLK
ncbi:c-type cytochrome [Ureibacillus thermophilus]|uniref:Cytochrome c n=1 Tax=Ureibacillus thermophilus TaxID=367743 RepID=A0A4P6UTQ5_9BACL|nr:cytochrome c [Ureibacillus thermophilus]QBK25248.1 cytochrome c [Ureibacillus thermophilus]